MFFCVDFGCWDAYIGTGCWFLRKCQHVGCPRDAIGLKMCVCACSWCYEVSREMGQPSWPHVAACKPLGTCGGCFGGLKSPADRTSAQFSAGAQHRRTLAQQWAGLSSLQAVDIISKTQYFVAIICVLILPTHLSFCLPSVKDKQKNCKI